jgi:hypothetical protein
VGYAGRMSRRNGHQRDERTQITLEQLSYAHTCPPQSRVTVTKIPQNAPRPRKGSRKQQAQSSAFLTPFSGDLAIQTGTMVEIVVDLTGGSSGSARLDVLLACQRRARGQSQPYTPSRALCERSRSDAPRERMHAFLEFAALCRMAEHTHTRAVQKARAIHAARAHQRRR